jgi:hypothetical protein
LSYLKAQNDEGAGGSESTARLLPFSDLPASLPGGPQRKLSLGAKLLRCGLSLAIVFHLFCVLLAPNGESSLGISMSALIQPYLYFFELTNSWNFFSPNPEPPIYVEYELLDKSGETLQRGSWPEKNDPYFLRERQNRRITATDFMVGTEIRAEKMMVPYLCGLEPKPAALRLWRAMYSFPTPAEIVSGKRKIGDDVGKDRKFVSHTFCNGGPS